MPPESSPQPPVPAGAPPPSPYPNAPSGPVVGGPGSAPPQPDYDFIMSSQKPSGRNLLPNLPGADSPAMRVLYISGGLLVLLVIFIIAKGFFGGNPTLTYFLNIAQDQQEMIHLAGNASEQQSLAVGSQNFAATAQLSLASSQTKTVQYIVKNGQKVSTKKLNLKVSTATDKQLEDAVAAATYDQTFKDIMSKKLAAYKNDLKQTYQQTKGPKGRALLNDEYKQAQLLQLQLDGPAN